MNIHFVNGHEKDLDMIAAAGHSYIRMDFEWQAIERAKGEYYWDAYDELTANLRKRGLRAIYILDYSNSLYEEMVEFKDPITGEERRGIASPQHTESIDAFTRWSAAAVERYREYNIIWELWNEPNVSFWRPEPDIAQYLTLAKATAKAIRKIVPEAVIIGPATSKVPLPFLESFCASGILGYLDGVSVHPYRDYSLSPETAVTDYTDLRKLIEQYAPAGKKNMPIISSEWGYASATKGISVEKQAEFITRMQLANLLYGIPISIWYDWKNDGDEPGNFEHNCGTVTSGLKPKPAYTAIQTLNTQLEGYSLLNRLNLKNENDYLLIFRNDKGNYKISAWTLDPDHSVIIENKIPKVAGAWATHGYGNILKLKTEQGKLILNLNGLPKYIHLSRGIRVN